MNNPIPCESLATKAELQELRDQINQLFGQRLDDPSQFKDVLSEGNLDGTILDYLLEDNLTVEEISGGSGDDILFGSAAGDDLGSSLINKRKTSNALNGGLKKGRLGIKSRTQIINSNFRPTNAVRKTFTPAQRAAAAKQINAALKQTETLGKATFAKANSFLLNFISLFSTVLSLLNYYLLEIQINDLNPLTQKNIDDAALDRQRSFDLNLKVAEVIANQNREELEAQIETLKQNLEISEANAEAYTQQIGQNKQALSTQDQTIVTLKAQLETVSQALAEEKAFSEDLLADFEAYRGDSQEEISALIEKDLELFEKITQLETVNEVFKNRVNETELDVKNTAEAILRWENYQNQADQEVQGILTLVNEPITVKSNEEIENTLIESRRRLERAKLILREYQEQEEIEEVPSRGGGGLPVNARDAITTMQNKQIEATAKIAGVDLATLANFPIPDYLSTRWDNPFKDIIDSLLPNITPNTTGDIETVNFEEFDTKQDDRFNNLAIAIAALTTTVNTNTSPEAISTSVGQAVCQNATQPSGCLTQGITNPLSQGQNALGDKLNTILGLLNAGANASILQTVNNINNVVTRGWASTAVDKTLNAANFALSLHNAVMLSSNVAETVLETIDVILDVIGVTDFEGNPINISEWLTNTLRRVIEGIIGAQTYTDLSLKLTAANRIYQAGMNILDNVSDLIDTTIELDEYTGENISKIGNALRDFGIVPYDAYGRMIEDLNQRQFSKWLTKIEQAEEATDNIYSIAENIKSIQDIGQELKESREEFDTALQDSNLAFTEAETELDTEIENIPEPTTEDEARG